MSMRHIWGRSTVWASARSAIAVGMLAVALCTGCSSSDQPASAGSTAQPGQTDASEESTVPTDSSVETDALSQQDTTSNEPTGYAAQGDADGYQTLGGFWKVTAITYEDKIISLSKSKELADLYDNVFLGFSKDGSFEYRVSVFITRGKYVPAESTEGAYILKAETKSRATIEDGKVTETEAEKSDKYYLVVTSEDSADTLGFVELDASTGKPKEGENPLYFEKTGSQGGSTSSSSDGALDSESVSGSGSSSGSSSSSGSGSSSFGSGNQKAADRARQYLRTTSFSHDGLVKQLEFEGFSHEDAVYGADVCGADWDEQAVLKAKQYLQTTAFSEKGLIEQLVFEKFTQEQAEYGVSQCGANWMEQAVKKARQYQEWSSMSRSGLIDQLEFEGFTHEQAVYGADNA